MELLKIVKIHKRSMTFQHITGEKKKHYKIKMESKSAVQKFKRIYLLEELELTQKKSNRPDSVK